MPNLKIFVDETLGDEIRQRLHRALPELRKLMCGELKVPLPLAQFAIVSVLGLPDQALLSVELHILPKAERTHDRLVAACEALREALREIADVKMAMRVTTVNPDTYITVR